MKCKTTKDSAMRMLVKEDAKEWVHCPICGNKTRVMVRNDTVLLNFPLHCPKCKNTSLIEVKDSEITQIE